MKEKLKEKPEITEENYEFDSHYKGSVLVKIAGIKQQCSVIIWWGEWKCTDIVLKPKNEEQYIHLTQGGGEAWPLTVFLDSPATSIEFIQNVVNVSDRFESQEGKWEKVCKDTQ